MRPSLQLFALASSLLPSSSARSPHPANTEAYQESSDLHEMDRDIASLMPSEADRGALFRNPHTYTRLPATDCHSRVATQLQHGCRGAPRQESGALSEVERIDFAISLTLCSMTSAAQPIPTECEPWLSQPREISQRQWWWGGAGASDRSGFPSQGCLSALHRSPQDWSSYNGYLSDAMQLCFALDGQRQEELAREIYANATAEKIDLLRMLKRDQQTRQASDTASRMVFEGHLEVLQDASRVAATASTSFENRLQEQDSLIALLRGAVVQLDEHKQRLWTDLERELGQKLDDLVQTVQQDMELASLVAGGQLSSRLETITEQHENTVSTLTLAAGDALQRLVHDARAELGLAIGEASISLSALGQSLAGFERTSIQVHQQVHEMAEIVLALRLALAESVDSAQALKVYHTESLGMWSTATEMSQQLNLALRTSLDTMNETARAVHDLQISAQQARQPRFSTGFSLFAAPTLLSIGDLSGYSSDPRIQAALAVLGWSGGAVLQGVWLLSSTLLWMLSLAVSTWVIIRAGLSRLVLRAARPLWRHLVASIQDERADEEQAPISNIAKAEPAESIPHGPMALRPRRSYGDIGRVKFELGLLPEPKPKGAATRPRIRRSLAEQDRRRTVSEPPM